MSREWRVLLPTSIDPTGPDSIGDFATCTGIDDYDSVDDALADIGAYDAVIVRVANLDAGVIGAAERLKVVSKHGAGLDNVDIDAANANGIVVCNTPGANARSVAEHTMTLLLGVHRNLRAADNHLRDGGWNRTAHTGHEVAGDTLGLFGCGAIARETAALAEAFGLSVLTYDPYISDNDIPNYVERISDPTKLFERADAVSVHAPLTPETRHVISTEELAALSSDGVLVNTSRGPVVDEVAMIDALENGVIAGAGLDVFESEPPSPDHPLFGRENVVVTPHIGGVTDAALRRMSTRAAENVRTVYDGGLPESTVNREALE